MKKLTPAAHAPKVAALLIALFASGAFAQEEQNYGEPETFTATNGKTIEATIVGKSDTTVSLKLANGSVAEVPIEQLIEEHQAKVRAWDGAKAIFLQQCRSLSVRELLELRGYESFVVDIEGNHVYVDGKLNDTPARFMIDTGAGTTLLHLQSAKDSKCEVGPMDQVVYGLGGDAPAAFVDVDKIEIGQTLIKDQKLLAADLFEDLPSQDKSHDALLGGEFLAQLAAVLDYREKRIFLRPDLADGAVAAAEDLDSRIFKLRNRKTITGKIVSRTPSAVTIRPLNGEDTMIGIVDLVEEDAIFASQWSEAGETFRTQCKEITVQELLKLRAYESHKYEREGTHIFIPGKVNGTSTPMMIDSGAGSSVMHVQFAEAAKCSVGEFSEVLYGIGGAVPAAPTKVPTIQVGSLTLHKRTLLSTDLFRGQPRGAYGMILGADFLREFNAVVSYREGLLMFKGND